jgi:glycosyltransferase 2 family protein
MKLLVSILKYVLAFGIAAFFIWWPLKGLTPQDKEEIATALRQASYLWFIPVAILQLFGDVFRALRWKQFITPLQYKPSFAILFNAVLVGYFANTFIPRAGEIARCTVVSKYEGIPAEKLLGTIVAERAFDTICLLLLAVITAISQYHVLGGYISEITHNLLETFAGSMAAKTLLLAAFIVAALIVIYCIRKIRSNPHNLFSKLLKGLWQGLSSIVHIRRKGLFILYTVIIWTCYLLTTWMGCFALASTASLGFTISFALLVFGSFGIIVAPGGLGAYPYAIQKTLLLYNVPSLIGLSLGWLLWLSQFVFNIFAGIVGFIYLSLIRKNASYKLHTGKDTNTA